jgi:transposase
LTRDQDALIQSQTRLVNQLTACLKAYYPAALQLFSKRRPRSTLIFLQTYPTPQEAQQATVAQIEATLRKGQHTHPTSGAPKIYEVLHQPHLEASEVTIRTKARLMQALVAQLLPLLEQIAAYDKEITELFLTHADSQIFASLPGAGKRLAPRRARRMGGGSQALCWSQQYSGLGGDVASPL